MKEEEEREVLPLRRRESTRLLVRRTELNRWVGGWVNEWRQGEEEDEMGDRSSTHPPTHPPTHPSTPSYPYLWVKWVVPTRFPLVIESCLPTQWVGGWVDEETYLWVKWVVPTKSLLVIESCLPTRAA